MVKLFNNFGMAIVAILMIVGFSAFKVSEKAKSYLSDYAWFETDSNGNIGVFIAIDEEPGGNCSLPIPPTPMCAVGIPLSHIVDYTSEDEPISPFSNASDHNDLVKRHQVL